MTIQTPTSRHPLKINLTGNSAITITRRFDAPPTLVFRALTEPALIRQWLYVDRWPIVDCQVDLKPGGRGRYVWRNPDGGEMGMNFTFRQVAAPHSIVHTEIFDEDWTGGETLCTTTLASHDGGTLMTLVVEYNSAEARDAALRTGMTDGMAEGYDRLNDLLPGWD